MTEYTVVYSSAFKRDFKLMQKRGLPMDELKAFIELLRTSDEPLDAKYRDHPLAGRYAGYRECHVRSDWLLIYKKEADILVLTCSRTGTHSDLFNK